MKYILIALTILLLFGVVTFGQETEVNPIDKKLNKCLETTKGNMPRAECYSAAAEAWENDIDTTYKALIAKLTSLGASSAEIRKDIEATQKTWEKYRDAEFALLFDEYGRRRGTGYIIPRITMRIDVMKPRALRLESLLEKYKGYGKD